MKNRYDIIVIGGGPNGLTIACYLAKCGLSVCLCEDRLECGGGFENTEPIPGFRIDPHATYLYGAAAPGFEQLELAKFGLRMVYYRTMFGAVTSDGEGVIGGRFNREGMLNSLKRYSERDAQVMEAFDSAFMEHALDILRSIYWTPPPPVGVTLAREELPWAKVFSKYLPMYDHAWNDMSTFEILDTMLDTEFFKVGFAMGSWYNGPHPDWAGTGIFGVCCNVLNMYSSGSPLGGTHSMIHALVRCALTHGATILTNSKVREIIVEDGEAKGVILNDDAPIPTKKLYADRAVISGIHIKDLFSNLVSSRHLDPVFLQGIKDINLKGGSLFVLSLIATEMPKFIGKAGEVLTGIDYPSCTFLPTDDRELVLNQMRDVYSFNTHPIKKESIILPIVNHDIFDKTRCPPGYHVFSPIYLQMPPPEYHVDGPEAVNKAQDEIVDILLEAIRSVAPNMTEKNIVAKFVNTPYDSAFRNLGFVGGNWLGISQCEDQWYNARPMEELARYRTPIHKLYLCNHTSYPGGLGLMAVPYNLMHILIEDLDLKPGEWWYPSPHYISEKEVAR
jgi:beta-carotene ketolase (CrtO type)